MSEHANRFRDAGAVFCKEPEEITHRLKQIKAYVFDWDGVFNSGIKGVGVNSNFSETDSMGINLLRYAHYKATGTMPFTGIITGRNNQSAFHFARREHLDVVYFGFLDKTSALEHLGSNYGIAANETFFMFDDVLDLSLAAKVGLRVLVNNPGSLMLREHVLEQQLADYITANKGDSYAVRETVEMLLGISYSYESTISDRIAYNEPYQTYFSQRNNIATQFFTLKEGRIEEVAV